MVLAVVCCWRSPRSVATLVGQPVRRSSSTATATSSSAKDQQQQQQEPRQASSFRLPVTVRRLPSLKQAPSGHHRPRPTLDPAARRTEFSALAAASSRRLEQADARPDGPLAARASAPKQAAPSKRRPPALEPPIDDRDTSVVAEMLEESRLVTARKKKDLRKYEDAFWRNFLGHGPALNSPLVPRQTPLPRSAASQPRSQRATPRRPHLPIEPALPEPTVFYDHLSYYATLEFDASSLDDFPSDDELKLSRFRLQTIHHPDVPGGSAKLSARINQAFDALSSAAKRRRYQAQGARQSKG